CARTQLHQVRTLKIIGAVSRKSISALIESPRFFITICNCTRPSGVGRAFRAPQCKGVMATKECRLYEERCIAFIDILGFGSLVEESGENVGLAESIFEALSSLHPNNIEKTAYGTINYENIPQEEVEAVEFIHARMLEAMKIAHPLTLTYFSD